MPSQEHACETRENRPILSNMPTYVATPLDKTFGSVGFKSMQLIDIIYMYTTK
jgi:hypothetical protein